MFWRENRLTELQQNALFSVACKQGLALRMGLTPMVFQENNWHMPR